MVRARTATAALKAREKGRRREVGRGFAEWKPSHWGVVRAQRVCDRFSRQPWRGRYPSLHAHSRSCPARIQSTWPVDTSFNQTCARTAGPAGL